MSIYSANRTGSMDMSQVVANESYGCNDLGRILYESQVNDQTLFEAILASDFREIHSLREGTLLESEIKAINEASFRTIIANLKERLKRFWAKIKAAFKDAMTKIAAYVLNDGKAFVKNFESVCAKYQPWTGSIPGVKRYWTGDTNKYCKVPDHSSVETAIKNMMGNENLNKNDLLKKILCNQKLNEDIEVSEYVKKVLEKSERVIEVNRAEADKMCAVISSGRDQIKALKKAESSIKTNIDKLGKALSDKERESNSENKDDNIMNITTLVSVYESVVTYTTRANIALIKADIRSCRSALGQVMSDLRNNGTKKDKKALGELAILEAADEIDAAFDNTAIENIDSDTQEAIDDLVSEEI